MDLNGDGLKDYACVNPDTGETKVAIRGGVRGKPTNDWGDMKVIATGAEGRKGSGVMFAEWVPFLIFPLTFPLSMAHFH
jgi:hypothetical protein